MYFAIYIEQAVFEFCYILCLLFTSFVFSAIFLTYLQLFFPIKNEMCVCV